MDEELRPERYSVSALLNFFIAIYYLFKKEAVG